MEALALVGGSFLSSLFDWLFGKLDFSPLLGFNKQNIVPAELEEWRSLLPKIQAVIDHAEARQMADLSVGTWLSDLGDLAYDMEDILDQFEFVMKANQLQAEARATSGSPPKRARLANSVPNFDTLLPKVSEVSRKLQQLDREKIVFKFQQISRQQHRRAGFRTPSTCLVEPYVYGRDEDREAIVQLLLTDKPGVCVIPIVGMGGVGKTTLAQIVYNDQRVKDAFDLRAWVCVSEEFDILRVTRSIVQGITRHSTELTDDLNLLQTKLKEAFGDRKFLLVLDDVWNENYESWDILRRPFLGGTAGSKVIITTRNHGVASMMAIGHIPPYALEILPDDECLRLFGRHALDAENFKGQPHLETIGKKIVKNCKGLPLAAKTLGGLLHDNFDLRCWEYILNSKIWDLPEERSNILPALRLSYHYLPSHLKRCFVYCAVFPKDWEFERNELVLLWKAEGFLRQPDGMEHMEDLCHESFDELVSRAFFQQSSVDGSPYFVMHNLMHDLAQSIAAESCFHLPRDSSVSQLQQAFSKKTRHFSFTPRRYDTLNRFEALKEAKRLRTWFALPTDLHSGDNYLSNKVLDELLIDLTCLRTLSFSGYSSMRKIPDSISNLIHLRYLDLSFTWIQLLPESVTSLIYLQTLILQGCQLLKELPTTIGNLMDLNFLDIRRTDMLENLPPELFDLKNLHVFIENEIDGLTSEDLASLCHFHGSLSTKNLRRGAQGTQHAKLKKNDLEKLSLECICASDIQTGEMQPLKQLKLHQVEKLEVQGYGGLEFPFWINDMSFSNMAYLEIRKCERISSLSSLGQLPFLKELIIIGMEGVQVVGMDSSFGKCSFQALEKLSFRYMPAWEEWLCFNGSTNVESGQHFPCLKELELWECPLLRGNLPTYLPSLKRLEIWGCPLLTASRVSLPSVEYLFISGCCGSVLSSLVDVTSLHILNLSDISRFTCLPKGIEDAVLERIEMTNIDQFVDMKDIKDLKELRISYCHGLKSFTGCKLPMKLKSLEIRACETLESLPEEIMHIEDNNSSMCLEALSISRCPCLESFPAGKLAPTLKSLTLLNCQNLRAQLLPIIPDCGSLLTDIMIHGCGNMEILPSFWMQKLDRLKTLRIIEGSSSDDISDLFLENGFSIPSKIQNLQISWFSHLKLLPSFHGLTSLKQLSIEGCPLVESFPEGRLPHDLESLNIYGFKSLKALPVLSSLMSLVQLEILNCPMIVSLPEGGLPLNLARLVIGCENIKQPMSTWGLHRLRVLRTLTIRHICPPDDLQLPPALIELTLVSMKELESISTGLLRNLTALETLVFRCCPKLQYLPKDLYLPPSLGCFTVGVSMGWVG